MFNPDPKPQPRKKGTTVKAIRRRTLKRAKQEREYLKQRPTFLEGKTCPVTGWPATQVHHMKGRIGDLLLDQRFWLAVSHEGHEKIENNPVWAKEQGYSMNRI